MNRSLSLCMVVISLVFLPHMLKGYKQLNSETRWPTPSDAGPLDPIVVDYYINENGDPGCTNGDEFEAVQKGIEVWSDISTSKIQFEYVTKTSRMPNWDVEDQDNYNVVGWIQSGWDNLGEGVVPYATAQARIFYTYQGGSIRETDLFINSDDYNWSADPDYSCPDDRFDVQNIVAHEAGHWCGLGDVIPDVDPLVFEQTMKQGMWCGQLKKRTLESDDIAGASYLYPYVPTWPLEGYAVYCDEYHHFSSDVAMAWNPTGKTEYLHLACLEGLYTTTANDTFVPFDSAIWPVRVVYTHNNMAGWNAKEILSGYHELISGPRLVTDKNDNQHIVWAERDGTMGRVVYMKRENGFWGSVCTLSDDPVFLPQSADIAVQHASSAVSPHGNNVYVTWIEQVGSRYVLMFRRCVAGYWYGAEEVGQSQSNGTFSNVRIAIDSTGGVHLVWRETTPEPENYLCWVKNSYQGASGMWGQKLTREQYFGGDPSIAVDGYGNVHIAYAVPGPSEFSIYYDRLTGLGNGAWQEKGAISPDDAYNPHVVCDNLGFVHFFWHEDRDDTKPEIYYARDLHMGDGEWSPGWGAKIYPSSLSNPVCWVGDVTPSDTFGDIFVGMDVWPDVTADWDIYVTLGREDDGVRELPWSGLVLASEDLEEIKVFSLEPQRCYLDASINRLCYFASVESRLFCYSTDGRRMKYEKVKGTGQLELSSLPSGVYFVHLQSDAASSSDAKLIVMH